MEGEIQILMKQQGKEKSGNTFYQCKYKNNKRKCHIIMIHEGFHKQP